MSVNWEPIIENSESPNETGSEIIPRVALEVCKLPNIDERAYDSLPLNALNRTNEKQASFS